MTDSRVICLGEILWDCLADQPGQSIDPTSWTKYPGGAPANVACALSKLGTASAFIGCVGEDEAGESLIDLLETLNVNVVGVQRHSAPTRQVEVRRSINGDRQFGGFRGRDTTEFADTHLQADLLPEDLFDRADYLVMGTLGLAYPETRNAMEYALSLADRNYTKIVIDVNWRPMFWSNLEMAKPLILEFLYHVDFLKLSVEEADWLFGSTNPGVIAHFFGNLEGVLVTDGERGCAYCLNENEGKIPAFKVNAVDTTGAGDSFLAGFIHQLCQYGVSALGQPEAAKWMVMYASAVGALTTIRAGAISAQPTATEVEAFGLRQGFARFGDRQSLQ